MISLILTQTHTYIHQSVQKGPCLYEYASMNNHTFLQKIHPERKQISIKETTKERQMIFTKMVAHHTFLQRSLEIFIFFNITFPLFMMNSVCLCFIKTLNLSLKSPVLFFFLNNHLMTFTAIWKQRGVWANQYPLCLTLGSSHLADLGNHEMKSTNQGTVSLTG